jgi:hypothetical protein
VAGGRIEPAGLTKRFTEVAVDDRLGTLTRATKAVSYRPSDPGPPAQTWHCLDPKISRHSVGHLPLIVSGWPRLPTSVS